jgi:cell division ATPase FtsA
MKFNFLFSKSKKPEYFLVLDIGTETIKTLIFKKENNKNIILGRILEYFSTPEVFGDFDFQEEILQKTISKTIDEVQKIAKMKIKNLSLGLPTNILRGRIIRQNFQRKNPKETINDIEERKIYETVFNQIKIKLSQEFVQKTGLLPQDFYFSNLKILETKIDGYEVPSIQNLNGQNLEFNVLAVFISKYQLEKIKKICQNLNLKISKIVHLAENLPYLFSDERLNAIFIDVGGKLTNIFWVERGKLVGISEFEKGGADFTQQISQNLGLFFPEARILKEDYSKLLLSEEINKRIKEIFSNTLQNWFENLKENFKKFPHRLLPSNLFLFGGGSLLPEIPEILEKGNFANLTFISKPKIGLIYPENLKDIEDKTHILNTPQDVPLLLISYEQKKIF